MTIIEAIKSVIQSQGKSLTIQQILDQIMNDNLYQFKAKYLKGVVATQIRRHCLGIKFPTANPVKHFILVEKNQYDIETDESDIVTKNTRLDRKDCTPEKILHNSYNNHRKKTEQLLLEIVLGSDPAFFEQLIINLIMYDSHPFVWGMIHKRMSSHSRRGSFSVVSPFLKFRFLPV